MLKKLIPTKETWISLVALGNGILIVVGVFWGFNVYLNKRVNAIIYDSRTISRISARVRPFIVFNKRAQILYGHKTHDMLIENMEIVLVKDGDWKGNVSEIFLETKMLLSTPPLLEILDNEYRYQVEQGEGRKWHYKLQAEKTIGWGDAPVNMLVDRFRLEFFD